MSIDLEIADRLGIPDALRKQIAADAPVRGRLAVAKGLLPAPPKVLLAMQYALLGDPDEKVVEAALAGLVGIPVDRLLPLLDSETHPKILELLAYKRPTDERLLEKIVLLRQANDKTLCYLAETGSERIAEIVGNNQERLITTPTILRFLRRNPRVPRSLVDRITTFQRLYGISVEEVTLEEQNASDRARQAATAVPAPTPQPIATIRAPVPTTQAEAAVSPWGPGLLVDAPPGPHEHPPHGEGAQLPSDFDPDHVYIPAPPTEAYEPPPGLLNPLLELLLSWGIEPRPEFVAPPWGAASVVVIPATAPPAAALPSVVVPTIQTISFASQGSDAEVVDTTGLTSLSDSEFSFGFQEEDEDFGGQFTEDKDDIAEGEKLSMAQAISKMTTGQKIKLAYKGNKTVRELLIRDTNKIVACAVVKGGRITDNEVMTIASNRSIHEDVIRLVADNKEWVRKYPVKLALASNPKTPIPVAMGFLGSLQLGDLKLLSNNRNVSSAVFSSAAKIVKAKQGGGR